MGIDEKDMYLHKCAAPHKEKCSITRRSRQTCFTFGLQTGNEMSPREPSLLLSLAAAT